MKLFESESWNRHFTCVLHKFVEIPLFKIIINKNGQKQMNLTTTSTAQIVSVFLGVHDNITSIQSPDECWSDICQISQSIFCNMEFGTVRLLWKSMPQMNTRNKTCIVWVLYLVGRFLSRPQSRWKHSIHECRRSPCPETLPYNLMMGTTTPLNGTSTKCEDNEIDITLQSTMRMAVITQLSMFISSENWRISTYEKFSGFNRKSTL